MSLVAIGGTFEVLFVDFGNELVVGRGADLEIAVVTIEAGGAHRDNFVGIEGVGLASAVDAAAGARHDFHDMILFLAGADVLADFFDVGKAEDLAEIELDAGDFDFGFADTFGATQGFEVEVGGLFGRILRHEPVKFSVSRGKK